MFTIILDSCVIFLLTLTIVFCWKLNSKIMELKNGRQGLLELIKTLDGAIIKTNTNIAELKVMTQTSASELRLLIAKAQELISDLDFMSDTAKKIADRLENGIADSRKRTINLEMTRPEAVNDDMIEHSISADIAKNDNGLSRAKDDLMAALKILK